MNQITRAGLKCAAIVFAVLVAFNGRMQMGEPAQPETSDAVDNDWFMLQRIYPYDDIDPIRYEQAKARIQEMAFEQRAGLVGMWELVGPTNIGGRITGLAMHPTNTSIIYAGAASGGVWKTTDGGTTWSNIFNESFSIGAVLLDPTNPDVVYVGTGEANPGGVAIYPGNGIWRSTDAGYTWANLGLTNVGQIGKIDIHPSLPGRIFVAALGRYRSRTQERGIYRSTDHGATWQRVLFLNDTTGACDVLIDPANPNRILAAMWTRYRPLTYSILNGPNSGLFLSTNGGDTWTQVTSGFPNNAANIGRMALAVAPSQPNIMYALVSNGTGVMGVYRSTDSGTSWATASTSLATGEGQSWFNIILAVRPDDPNYVLAGLTNLYRSTNGGTSWSSLGSGGHVDQHAMLFDPANPSRVILGNDGGVYTSATGGPSPWTKSLNLPISQFYAGTVDFQLPERHFGGTQDNGTLRTLTGAHNNWTMIYGGDGFYVLVDPTNSNRIYAESQNGGLVYSTNGGSSFVNGTTGISASDRKNWNTPIAMDLTNPLTLYTGTHRLYRTTNGMANWTAISGDLTRGPNGRIGTITTIDVARTNPNVIFVGTDDGKVSVTTDGGTNWTDVTGILPLRWVTRVTIDPDSANVAYVTLSGYLQDMTQSHIYRTSDYGQTWIAIGGTLPDIPLNDVIVDPVYRPNLYVASDAGVLYSTNMGTTWQVLGRDLPFVTVHDLTLHSPTRKLVAFTHGRSAFKFDLTTLTSVADITQQPVVFTLEQNYPNPFNPSTRIAFHIRNLEPQTVSLKVYDVLGREVATLMNNRLQPGSYEVSWNATGMPSGVYFYRLTAGQLSATRRMLLLR